MNEVAERVSAVEVEAEVPPVALVGTPACATATESSSSPVMDRGASAKGYLAGGAEYFYPEDGDMPAPGGADVHLLTIGGVCVRGTWSNDGRYLGWAPLPKANHEREARIREKRLANGKRRTF